MSSCVYVYQLPFRHCQRCSTKCHSASLCITVFDALQNGTELHFDILLEIQCVPLFIININHKHFACLIKKSNLGSINKIYMKNKLVNIINALHFIYCTNEVIIIKAKLLLRLRFKCLQFALKTVSVIIHKQAPVLALHMILYPNLLGFLENAPDLGA